MHVSVDGARVHYGSVGAGDPVVLLGEAGFGPWQWGWQHDAFAGPYRVLTPSPRGHGDSTGSPDSVATLAGDLDAVLAHADVDRAHLVGFGLGGVTALHYAREFGRARTLTLVGTAPRGEAVDADAFRALFADPADLSGLFTDAFRVARPDLCEQVAGWRREEDAEPSVRAAALDACRAFDAGPLYELTTPTLVLHAVDDPVVPMAVSAELGDGLPNGRFEAVAGRRLAHAEFSAAVNDEVLGFLEAHPLD
ncbi:alpha/beta hydrolase [Salinirubellus salinus]|uniref:Alpha/beta hydrolase n=1 Tax=Salinirubellus salinus TaxID=1364945 RepID=A0A9E7R1V7_9EURY|nr:alpha/beta hydrolase [Salinirubellus salinus]UWM54102.1 alpha/beta hydrolase [Salinirubellus salinus]